MELELKVTKVVESKKANFWDVLCLDVVFDVDSVEAYFIIFSPIFHNSFIACRVLYSHDAEELRRRLKRANRINYHKQPFLL